jgi:hypothetical protein
MSTWLATTLIAVWTRQPGCETTVISNLSSGARRDRLPGVPAD